MPRGGETRDGNRSEWEREEVARQGRVRSFSAIEWETEETGLRKTNRTKEGCSFRDAPEATTTAAAAAAAARGKRREPRRPAVGPGMIPAVSIYMRARGANAHNLLAVCSCCMYSGTRVIVLHRVLDTRVPSWLAGWLADRLPDHLSLFRTRAAHTSTLSCKAYIRTPDRTHTRGEHCRRWLKVGQPPARNWVGTRRRAALSDIRLSSRRAPSAEARGWRNLMLLYLGCAFALLIIALAMGERDFSKDRSWKARFAQLCRILKNTGRDFRNRD